MATFKQDLSPFLNKVANGVGPGSGLRAVLVFCVHAVMARGVDYLGLKVDWGKKTQSASK